MKLFELFRRKVPEPEPNSRKLTVAEETAIRLLMPERIQDPLSLIKTESDLIVELNRQWETMKPNEHIAWVEKRKFFEGGFKRWNELQKSVTSN